MKVGSQSDRVAFFVQAKNGVISTDVKGLIEKCNDCNEEYTVLHGNGVNPACEGWIPPPTTDGTEEMLVDEHEETDTIEASILVQESLSNYANNMPEPILDGCRYLANTKRIG